MDTNGFSNRARYRVRNSSNTLLICIWQGFWRNTAHGLLAAAGTGIFASSPSESQPTKHFFATVLEAKSIEEMIGTPHKIYCVDGVLNDIYPGLRSEYYI